MSREYQLENGMSVKAPERSCLFCKHCTDIWYDWGGIWGLTCYKEGRNIEKGSAGECELFEPEEASDGED